MRNPSEGITRQLKDFARGCFFKIFNSYSKVWNFHAMREKTAMRAILTGVEDEATFDAKGEEFVEQIRCYIKKDDVVLDVGCGIGRIEKFLAPLCREIYAVDISSKMLKIARKRLKDYANIRFIKNDGRSLSFLPDESIDFAVSTLVFQHIEKEDTVCYLADIYRVLKNNGSVYLQFPNILHSENCFFFLNYSLENRTYSPAKMRFYTPDEVRCIMEGIGFQIVALDAARHIFVYAQKRRI
ncbi:TPA: class I SAM-dependent methyltransferase [Candidatus Poribacteria bacterium]|nr:class I SAM-dependent methyltransferase [Candidatus Poribacteria bacterium]